MCDFIIVAFDISEEDISAIESNEVENKRQARIKECLAELERLGDKQWERDKYLHELQMQDSEAYYSVLKVIGHPTVVDNRSNNPNQINSFCPHCGKPTNGNQAFCSYCGKPIVGKIICPTCGTQNEPMANFCAKCGASLK